MENVFIESSDVKGLLYDRYCKVPNTISKFLDNLDGILKEVNSEMADLSNDQIEQLKKNISTFKSDVEVDISDPDPINVNNISKLRNKIKEARQETEKCLDRLSKMKKISKFGDNWIKGILIKPKVYQNATIDEEKESRLNESLREISRAMDWSEKVILDILNMADRDLNLLSIVQKIYFRRIFEMTEMSAFNESDILDENIDEDSEVSVVAESSILDEDVSSICYESSVGKYLKDDEEDKEVDILDEIVKKDNEEYFPVFAIIVSYDQSKIKECTKEQKAMITRWKAINKITLGDEYSHTIVSFDTSFEHMFHFMGKGFDDDSITKNPAYEISKAIYVNVTFVTKSERDDIINEVKTYREHKDDTAYDLKQLIMQLFGKSNHKDKRQICSTFVGYLLTKANVKNVHRDYSLIRPEDITILPRSFYVATFKNAEDFANRKKEFEERVQNIYNDNIEEIREYNNSLPKVLLKDQFKKAGSLDKLFAYLAQKM